jgi:hypothetical protein
MANFNKLPKKLLGIITVAKDGADHRKIQTAINEAASVASANAPWGVQIGPGVYNENITIPDYVHVTPAIPGTVRINGTITVSPNGSFNKGAPANTLTVGASGCDYTSIQAAVDAAQLAGASATSPWHIIGYEGADWNCLPIPAHIYVTNLAREAKGPNMWPWSLRGRDLPSSVFQTPYDMAMVAIRFDDNKGIFCEAQSALGGMSPQAYLKALGVPYTMAVIANMPTNQVVHTPGGYMTICEIQASQLMSGAEIMCHTATHDSSYPSTEADVIRETLSARRTLEHMYHTQTSLSALNFPDSSGMNINSFDRQGGANLTPWQSLGAVIRGYVNSGNWNQAGQAPLEMATEGRSRLWHTIRQYFEYSQHAQYAMFGQAPLPRHGVTYKNLINGVAVGARNVITPNTRHVFLFHAAADTDWSAWKTAIDRLVAARNAGDLVLVTMDCLYNGLSAPYYGPDSHPVWGGIPDGSFTNMTSLPSSEPGWTVDTNVWWGSNGASLIDGNLGKAVNLPNTGELWCLVRPQPGRSHMLRFKAKGMNGSEKLHVSVRYYWTDRTDTTMGSSNYDFRTNRWYNITYTGALTENPYDAAGRDAVIYVPFYMPLWAQTVKFRFVNATGSTSTIVLDDVELAIT